MSLNSLDILASGYTQPVIFYKLLNSLDFEGTTAFTNSHYYAGMPGAMTTPSTPSISGLALTSYPGQVKFWNPFGGQKCYLGSISITVGNNLLCMMYDRLWHNSGIDPTVTTAQAINSLEWPARCEDANGGSTPNTSGYGVYVALEVSTTTTNVSATAPTLNYTNHLGVSNRTATLSFPATAVKGAFVPFMLASGDLGVQSIQSVTLVGSLGIAGVVHLVAYRPLCLIPTRQSAMANTMNIFQLNKVELYENTVPFMSLVEVGTLAPTHLLAKISYVHC